MNNLDAVAFRERGVYPVSAAHDLAVQFDGIGRASCRERVLVTV